MSQFESKESCLELIAKCDALIKSGEIGAISSLMSKVVFSKVPRAQRQSLAKVCRRAGLIDHGLRLLHPIVRGEKLAEPARPGELCEYAVLLSRNGSTREALELLGKVDSNAAPEAMLYEAFCRITTWDYPTAASLLERFLESKADAYSKLIARVNLGAAYLAIDRHEEALTLLNETIELARKAGATRLVGNCLEQRGHYHFQSGAFELSRKDLDEALSIFGNSESYDQLLIFKWRSIIEASERASIEPLVKFRELAVSRRHWESVREADLFRAKVQFDQFTFDHLLFGTPLPGYRAWARKQIPHSPSESFVLGDPKSKLCLEIDSGRLLGASEPKIGKKIHQVIAALTKDFYLPRNIGSLYSELYPGEYFNIDSSPLRVRQILHRARRWLEENGVPASIVQDGGSYRFEIQGKFGIRIPYEAEAMDSQLGSKWLELKGCFPAGVPFTAQQACERMKMSRSGFLRLTQWARDEGVLKKDGSGKATLYEVVAESTGAPARRAG